MTDLKNNLEEVWNNEFYDWYYCNYDLFKGYPIPTANFRLIYFEARKKSQEGIDSIRTQLLAQCKISRELIVEKEQLEQELKKSREHHEKCMISFGIKLTETQDRNEELLIEIQKTREQLNKCESALNNYAICDDIGTAARRYFKEKDKQGE